MTRSTKFFLLVAMAGVLSTGTRMIAAETPEGATTGSHEAAESPTAEVRNARSWEYGPFLNWGTGVGDRSDYKFFWGGAQVGKELTPVLHAGVLSGQFEFAGNVMPLWQAYTPSAHTQTTVCSEGTATVPCTLKVGGGTFRGVSLTPVIFRWNFATRSKRIQPWVQAAGGLIYTTHKFPPSYLASQTINGLSANVDGGTCVWNFSPQGGVGIHYFTRAKRSIDIGLNAVHISSASLGDHNPGVNASLQVQVGYTFWK